MSDKSKLSYYFTRTTEIPLQESSNTCVNVTVNTDIANTNEIVVLGESDDIPQCSSTISILHDRSESVKVLLAKIYYQHQQLMVVNH
jgi:hypothetical protein